MANTGNRGSRRGRQNQGNKQSSKEDQNQDQNEVIEVQGGVCYELDTQEQTMYIYGDPIQDEMEISGKELQKFVELGQMVEKMIGGGQHGRGRHQQQGQQGQQGGGDHESMASQARAYFDEIYNGGKGNLPPRREIIQYCTDNIGLTQAAANTYYQNWRAECGLVGEGQPDDEMDYGDNNRGRNAAHSGENLPGQPGNTAGEESRRRHAGENLPGQPGNTAHAKGGRSDNRHSR